MVAQNLAGLGKSLAITKPTYSIFEEFQLAFLVVVAILGTWASERSDR